MSRLVCTVALFLVLPSIALAEGASGQLTRPPAVTRFVAAEYPVAAEQAGLAGSVLLELDVGVDGKVTRAVVLEGAGHGFDEAALEAVKQFEFSPAEIDHQPVAVRITYRYEFVLKQAEAAPSEARAFPSARIEGEILQRGKHTPIPFATIVAEHKAEKRETLSDREGRFVLGGLTPGAWTISVAAAGFEPATTTETIEERRAVKLTTFLRRQPGAFETVVRSSRERSEITRHTLEAEEARNIPGTTGDVVHAVQNLPGVARTPLGMGPLIVRGGRAGDTRTYVDGQFVPMIFHFGGGTSAINPSFLESVDFYSGNLPGRLGRSIAGAVDLTPRAGKRDRVQGYADVNLTEASAFLEGPLGKSSSFMASVRRSYIDAVLPIVAPLIPGADALNFTLAPRYWDYQLKLDSDVGKNHLSLFVYGSDDRLAIATHGGAELGIEGRSSIQSRIGFHRVQATWRRSLSENVKHKLSFGFGVDDTANALGNDITAALTMRILTLREDLQWKLSNALTLETGADVIGAQFTYALQTPPLPVPGELYQPLLGDNLVRTEGSGLAVQPGVYVNVVVRPIPALRMIPSVRVDGDSYIGRAWVDPRLSAFYALSEQLLLKAGVGLYHQPPSPDRLVPKLGNPKLREERSVQYGAGVEWRPREEWLADLQLFYKEMQESVNAATLNYANTGQGRAYGAELLLKRRATKGLNGWVALSLGQVFRRNFASEPWATSYFGQRYNVTTVLQYKLPRDITIGTRLRLVDGNALTGTSGSLYSSDGDTFIPISAAQEGTVRLPAFFQADLRIDKQWIFERWILDTYLDIQNVTNRANVESLKSNYDYTRTAPLTGLPLFPSLGIRGEF
jgi:TonB family protein